MTVTSQRPLKILIRYKKRSLSSISLFLKVKWPSDSIKSGQLPTKCFGFGKYILIHYKYNYMLLIIKLSRRLARARVLPSLLKRERVRRARARRLLK